MDENAKRLVDAATAHFLRTGRDARVEVLAEELGWSVGKVRRVLAANGGRPDGLQTQEVGFGRWEHAVYGPSRAHLRQLLSHT